MRHKKQKATLGREAGVRKALMRSLVESLVMTGSMKTTSAKARAIRRFVEPLVTKAKKDTLVNRRAMVRFLYTTAAVNKMMKEIGPRYAQRQGGYTRITKLGARRNDAAEMVRIEFV